MKNFDYRAWHIPTGRIFEVFSIAKDYVFEESMDGIHTSPTLPAKREDCILLPYTGLNDIDGNKIYEGDVVETELQDGKVVKKRIAFKNGAFRLVYSKRSFLKGRNVLNAGLIFNTKVKIIDNFYANGKRLTKANAPG